MSAERIHLDHPFNLPESVTPSSTEGTLVSWLWEKTCLPKVVGSYPGAIYWIDITFYHNICVVRIVMVV